MEEKKWYVVNTYSGHESKVKEKLDMRINSMEMQENIFRVIVPERKEVEIKDGKKKEKIKKLFPGYVLVEMIMSDESWYGDKVVVNYEVGDKVKITDGPFKMLAGKITDIDIDAGKANVSIDLFGQETNVELELTQFTKE